MNAYVGASLQSVDLNITSDGSEVKAKIQKQGGGDLQLVFSDEIYTFDATPQAEVSLTAGTNSAPQLNYIFIPKTTKTLTANTTG